MIEQTKNEGKWKKIFKKNNNELLAVNRRKHISTYRHRRSLKVRVSSLIDPASKERKRSVPGKRKEEEEQRISLNPKQSKMKIK